MLHINLCSWHGDSTINSIYKLAKTFTLLFDQIYNNNSNIVFTWLNLTISLVDTYFRSKVYTSINSIFWCHAHEYPHSKRVLNKRSNFSQIIVFSLQEIGIISNKGYLEGIYWCINSADSLTNCILSLWVKGRVYTSINAV